MKKIFLIIKSGIIMLRERRKLRNGPDYSERFGKVENGS